MNRGSLDSVFKPQSIALVGASEENAFARTLVANNEQFAFGGPLYLVNRTRQTVFGRSTYPSVSSLPEHVDCAVISVARDAVLSAVEESIASGFRGIVVHSAGFAESDAEGKRIQRRIGDICRANQIALVGPNCLGTINCRDRIAMYGGDIPPSLPSGHIGAVVQSGGASIVLLNNARHLGFSYIASTGNEAVVALEDILDYYISDPDTHVIVAFVESFRRPRRFLKLAARALRARKPIVMLKVGTTSAGASVSATHTGALAGSRQVAEAVFQKFGVIQVGDFDELIEMTYLCSTLADFPRGGRTAVTSISGGELALAADIAQTVGVALPTYSKSTSNSLRRILALPDFVAPGNPLDVGAGFRSALRPEDRQAESILALADDPSIDIVAVIQDAQAVQCSSQVLFSKASLTGVRRATKAMRRRGVLKPVIAVSPLSAAIHPELAAEVESVAVPFLKGARESLSAIRKIGDYAALVGKTRCASRQRDASKLRQGLRDISPGTQMVGEQGTKTLLSTYGLTVSQDVVARTPDEAAAIAERLGFPVAVKLVSRDVLHKSDVGGVCLNLASPSAASQAFNSIIRSVHDRAPHAVIEGVVVSKYVDSGVELLLGIKADPQFGPVVVIGLGGILVDVFRMTSVAIPPIDRCEATSLVESFVGNEVLDGVRGAPKADRESVVDAIMKLGELAFDSQGIITELDLNPLIVTRTRAVVVDARMRLSKKRL
jgi:acyl-CoA synthetase (NDP forming)